MDLFVLSLDKGVGSFSSSTMACQEDGIEPAAAISAVQNEGRGHRLRDILNQRRDELDALISENRNQPFRVVHNLKNAGRPSLIRGTPITCRMDNVEKNTSGALDDEDTLYTFHLTHGNFQWTVKRKYKHFQELQRDLYLRRILLYFRPFERFEMNEQQQRSRLSKMPNLDGTEQTRRTSKKGLSRCPDSKHLEDYLNSVLEKSFCRNAGSMMDFLYISPLSFINDLGPKGLEGPIIKSSGGYETHALQCICNNTCCFLWSHRWMVVKDSFLMFINRDDATINGVMLFDPKFQVKVQQTGLCIENTARSVIIKCSSDKETEWWGDEIKRLTEACDFLKVHRFGGFAPPRENTLTKWYVNGSGYFADLADALKKAKEEIFITDWWLSPKVFLKRPANDKDWRLDKILQERAKDGVKVFILLYREVTYALSINSNYSKRALRKKHRNIKVIRHPDHVSSGVIFWAHHEKMVAIDQTVAFVGGIDLTLGRWDDNQYRLTDLGFAEGSNGVSEEQLNKSWFSCHVGASHNQDNDSTDGPKTGNQPKQGSRNLSGNTKLWLGQDYNNFVLKDWVKPEKPFQENVDRTRVPRMPWRDLSAAVHGGAARDVARHFIQRWNLNKISKRKYRDNFYPYLVPKSHSTADSLPFIVPGSSKAKVQVLRSADRWSTKRLETSIQNAYIHTIEKSEHFIYIENQFFISCADNKTVYNGIGDAIVKRILRAHSTKKKFRVFVVIPLLPGFEGDIKTGGGNAIRTILHFTYRTICRGEVSILSQLSKVIDNWQDYITFCGLRTHSKLSGLLVTELIYVHSKILIADDRRYIIVVVLLSANSEPSINIEDPVSDDFFGIWNKTAKLNTNIYEQVFKCLPCDTVQNMQQLNEYSSQQPLCDTNLEKAEEELRAVRGLLVHFPLKFLSGETLLPPSTSKEGMAPLTLWT
ncbi:phospholipase D1-like [Nematolebias whitei]|uniref:phospholipase D1-like n=1 Tax=Nematolebias whitei TaxID=451745 RepID=UPI00189B7A5C|nr:phospholipase D1-like [Nematolebias whitei]